MVQFLFRSNISRVYIRFLLVLWLSSSPLVVVVLIKEAPLFFHHSFLDHSLIFFLIQPFFTHTHTHLPLVGCFDLTCKTLIIFGLYQLQLLFGVNSSFNTFLFFFFLFLGCRYSFKVSVFFYFYDCPSHLIL